MRIIILALILVFSSHNYVNAAVISDQFIKQANAPIIANHEEAKELASMKVQMNELANQQVITQTESSDKFAKRRGGGRTASVDILGTYRLSDSSSSSLFLDIIDAEINKDGTGAIEYALSLSDGSVISHSVGVILKNQLSFQVVLLSGALYYALSLNPQKSYSGTGSLIAELVADACADVNGDGVLEIGDLYVCQYAGQNLSAYSVSMRKVNL